MSTEDTNKAVVTLHNGVDVDAFIEDMVSGTNHTEFMPNRPVELYNEKPDSLRNVDFILTLEEANNLKNDPRIIDVRWGTKAENGIFAGPNTNDGGHYYSKTFSADSTHFNWALPSSSNTADPFISSAVNYIHNYNLAGAGVDVVIQDSGLNPLHPEWLDPTGTYSRLQQINWPVDTGLSSLYTQGTNFYSDQDGHGTHVTSSTAGRLYGWAKNANIYSMKIFDTDAFAISPTFNMIRLWHQNKTIQNTGSVRPTIVNMSWAYYGVYPGSYTVGGNYRGSPWIGNTSNKPEYGMVQNVYNQRNYYGQTQYTYPIRVSSVEADILDCMNAGVIFVGAAGNEGHKIDIPGGLDYNNYVTKYTSFNGYENNYYHRGSTPGSTPGVITVGAIGVDTIEKKADYSNCGPRVNVYAPGTAIASAIASTTCSIVQNGTTASPYPGNSSFYTVKISGTSMASPQVTGVVACMLEARPHYKYTDVQEWLANTATKNRIYNTKGSYVDYSSLQDPTAEQITNLFLYNPFTKNSTWSQASFDGPNLTDSNNIPYGYSPLQKVDLYMPTGIPKGVIVFAHPGGWVVGDKTSYGVGNELLQVRDAGYIVVNCNYRLSDSVNNGYGMNLINDISTVINFLTTTNAGSSYSDIWEKLRYWVDLKGMIIAGGSAGGQIAVMAAGLNLTKPQIKAVVSMAGPMDLDYGVRYTANADIKGFIDIYTQGRTSLRQDCSPLHRFANYTPLANREPCLYSNLQNSTAKFYFVTNTNDSLVPTDMVQPFVTFLGNRATLITVTDDDPSSGAGINDHNYFKYTYHQFLTDIASQVFV